MPAHRVSGLPTAPKSSHYLFIGLWKHELYTFENSCWLDGYCSFAYTALACFRMGMLGSASFHSVRKSLSAASARMRVALASAPCEVLASKAFARATPKCANAPVQQFQTIPL
jgi:hypothetical protein